MFFHLLFLLTAEYRDKHQVDFLSLKSEKVYSDESNVDFYNIISSKSSYERGDTIEIILPIEISQSYYIYWKGSNSVGLPTRLNFQLPKGISLEKVEFSRPSVYKSDVVGEVLQMKGKSYFLILLRLEENIDLGKKDLELLFFYQLCKDDLCFFPKTQRIKFSIEVAQKKGKKNQLFQSLFNNFPKNQVLEKIVEKKLLDDQLTSLSVNKKDLEYFFFFNLPKGKRLFSRKNLSQYQFNKKDLLSWVAWGKNNYYVSNGNDNVLSSQALEPIKKNKKNLPADNSVLFYLLIGFIGGFILNFMPCVFPVVSLKLLKIIEEKDCSYRIVIKNNLYFAFGIISSLLLLVIVVLGVKYSSSEFADITWGAQLQSPYFVYILLVVFSAICLNLFGVFEFGLFFTKFAGRQKKETKGVHYFLNGVLTTIASTPCLAPFFSSAIAFAFSAHYFTTILVFLFIGLGLASPFLVLAFLPFLKHFLPRPGAWLKDVKIILGFVMSFVVLWLITVLEGQLQESFSYSLYMLGILFFSLWIYGYYAALYRGKKTRLIAGFLSLGLIVYVIITTFFAISNERYLQSISSEDRQKFYVQQKQVYWENFSPEYYEQLKKEGKKIFVSFTASWCLSCKVNEQLVFASEEFFNYINQQNIICLKADFTDYNKNLGKFLTQYNASGVPFYLFFSPQRGEVYLPNILTNNIIIKNTK